jgi:hypothetical protein
MDRRHPVERIIQAGPFEGRLEPVGAIPDIGGEHRGHDKIDIGPVDPPRIWTDSGHRAEFSGHLRVLEVVPKLNVGLGCAPFPEEALKSIGTSRSRRQPF